MWDYDDYVIISGFLFISDVSFDLIHCMSFSADIGCPDSLMRLFAFRVCCIAFFIFSGFHRLDPNARSTSPRLPVSTFFPNRREYISLSTCCCSQVHVFPSITVLIHFFLSSLVMSGI